MALKRLAMLAGAGACTLALAACGSSGNVHYADNLGPGYVEVGKVYYQVQLSRGLNPFSDEDSSYLQGFNKTQLKLPISDEWFGVFMAAYNNTSNTQTPASDYYITDTLDNRYTPIPNPDPNAFTYQPAAIPPHGQLPSITSNAYASWTSGEVLVFKIPYTTLGLRPLTLHIVDPGDPSSQSEIELDL
jgi:hypothetical protein